MSLFEALGIADQERVHTQMLAWLVSDSGPLDAAQRQMLLELFFERKLSRDDVSATRVSTELNHLDLVVLYPGGLIGLENKMKARASPGQLAKYSDELGSIAAEIGHPRGDSADLFLTFSGEDSKCTGWKSKSYDELCTALKEVGSSNAYVVDYVDYLSRLIGYRDEFLRNHTAYLAVFRGSGMSSIRRLKLPKASTALEEFVCSNRLERIFIETLFRRVAENAGVANAHIDESNGRALIHLNLFRVWLSGAPRPFRVGLQIQGDTKKLNIGAEEYQNSDKSWLSTAAERALDASVIAQCGSLRKNAKRTKAYRSWSEPIATPLHRASLTAFGIWYRSEVAAARKNWQAVLEVLAHQGIVAKFVPT